jgi:phosphopantetheinyl transferase
MACASGPPDAVLGAWNPGPLRPRLAEGTVHVWRCDTRRFAKEAGGADRMRAVLAPEERTRAERIQHLEHRLQWMASRAALRALLGRYLGTDPSELGVVPDAFGKPAIDPARAGGSTMTGAQATGLDEMRSLSFNLSHSGELMVCAFAPSGAIGVDIEVARRASDHAAVAARVFGAEEARRLERLDAQVREREFLRLWTRHEATLKCRGTGLGFINKSRGSGAPVGVRGSNVTWVAELDVGANAAGALASEHPPSSVQLWETASAPWARGN